MTLSNNYVHAIMKQRKTKTDCLRGLSVFVFIVNKLGRFEGVGKTRDGRTIREHP